MKFGDTLWQRSVPQWRNFNIDYHALKTHLKTSTSANRQYLDDPPQLPGKAKSISIPTPGRKLSADPGPSLEDTLFDILKKEHDRVGLFVRSKWYEVGSRLGSIERQLVQLQRRQAMASSAPKSQLKLRAKFSKIETDILSVGNELQNLSRFISINRLAIRKLLKKYQKWTRSATLELRVQDKLLDQPESFTKTDLAHGLARYTAFLSAVREPFREQPARSDVDEPSRKVADDSRKSSLALVSLFQKSEIDFDAAMTLSCSNANQQKVTYWVLPDNIVELRILLLQHMRYAKFDSPSETKTDSKPADSSDEVDRQEGEATSAGAVVLEKATTNSDDGQSPTAVSPLDTTLRPPAIARWTTTGEARVCVQPSKTETDPMGIKSIVKLEKDRLLALLPLDSASRRREISRLTDEELYATSDDDKGQDNILRGYIQRNADLKPVARICHKRSRFFGLESSSSQGFWASLDEDVRFTGMSGAERKACDVYKISDETGQRFPHAVLTLRAETANPTLLSVLDSSHLTERVDSFSLEAHAYAVCCGDSTRQNPPWLSRLTTDIRHIPTVTEEEEASGQSRTCSRKSSNIEQFANSSKSHTPNLTSRSGTSASPGPVTPDAEAFIPPAVRAPIEKHSKSSLAHEKTKDNKSRHFQELSSLPELQVPQVPQVKYWNEYDNPGSEMGGGDADGFYIYVDPDAPLFPGQVSLVRWTHNVKSFFGRTFGKDGHDPDLESQGRPKGSSRAPPRTTSRLLSVDSDPTSSDDDDDVVDADDELSRYTRPSAQHFPATQGLKLSINTQQPYYGTFVPPPRTANTADDMLPLRASGHAHAPAQSSTTSLCFAAALLLETAMSILLSTSRRSYRGEVDFAVLVGVVAALGFAALGIGAFSRRRQRPLLPLLPAASSHGDDLDADDNADTVAGGAKAALKGVCFVVVCVWAGVLLGTSLV